MKTHFAHTGTKAGVQSYLAWSQKDRDVHMAVLETIDTELTASGELVATEGLAVPDDATLVRGEKGGMPVTDGVSPSPRSFSWATGSLTRRLQSALTR